MDIKFRCDCPITSALDILGDRWILVIIKQMLLEDSKTFKDFIQSDERIATNILSTKLKLMEHLGIITKSQLPGNKKTNLYYLTETGLDLTPIVVELALWSGDHLRGLNPIIRTGSELEAMKTQKTEFIESLKTNYRKNKQSA